MAKNNGAHALIIALAKQKAAEKRPKKGDDLKTAAKGIMAAIRSGSEADLAEALRAFNEVDRSDD
jgi:hypothetical protein